MNILDFTISVLLAILFPSLLANCLLARHIAFLKRRAEVGKTLKNSINDEVTWWMSRTIEARMQARQLQSRVEQLEPALAECVAALREIEGSPYGEWEVRFDQRRDLAREALKRIQIPDDELPTERYPDD